jgi:hypothetical protein
MSQYSKGITLSDALSSGARHAVMVVNVGRQFLKVPGKATALFEGGSSCLVLWVGEQCERTRDQARTYMYGRAR